MALPTIGRIVIYRHPLPKGSYDVPAIVSATRESVDEARNAGLDTRHIRQLTGDEHLHLTVFSPLVTCPDGVEHARDVPPAGEDDVSPGTWRWPERPTAEQTLTLEQAQISYDSLERRLLRRLAERQNARYA